MADGYGWEEFKERAMPFIETGGERFEIDEDGFMQEQSDSDTAHSI